MQFRRLILLVVVIIGVLIFFKTEYYSNWLETHVKAPPIEDQLDHTSIEQRMEYRFNNLYRLCQYMKKTLDTTKFKNGEVVILLPPNDYIHSVGSDAFHLPEPAEFYYHTGLKTVWTTSPDVEKANWWINVQAKNNVSFVPIRSKEELHAILETYKKFKPAL